MGLTHQSTGTGALKEMFEVQLESPDDLVIALAGNPNTGKSTVFNALTGLNQHTGNWPGKTVANAQGRYTFDHEEYILVDLPGTYSLLANSVEEQVARDFICFGHPHATVVVVDATCLERNLNLVLQILEITHRVVVCVNLLDEALRKKIRIDLEKLSQLLGVPVVGTSARSGKGLEALKATLQKVALGEIQTTPVKITYDELLREAIKKIEPHIHHLTLDQLSSEWTALRLIDGDDKLFQSISQYLHFDLAQDKILQQKIEDVQHYLKTQDIGMNDLGDRIVSSLVKKAEAISQEAVHFENKEYHQLDRKIDGILTSRIFGIPIMIGLLGIIFWLTIAGANVPSALLADGLFWIEERLTAFFMWLNAPELVHGILILGIYRTLAWVVSVMLPPMAIFFPLFTLLEDLGYLPRVAFNLDHFFKRACAHGKQALTMCMGFGCNAAGIISCRIIDSPRERLIAIMTNNFVPCNGRFPTLIALATIFIAGGTGLINSLTAALSVLGAIVLGVMITLFISKLLSQTILKGLPSSFTLE